ncbi:MAG: hypothetical protein QOI20_2869 [Acidimicrobiaceae bacterium]|jgi:hypothetical protein|nr:hypothetical protein [Acidimicrobiaceae bacterium]
MADAATAPTSRRKGVLIAGAVLLAAAAAIAAVLVLTTRDPADNTPRAHAVRACADATRFEAAVKSNAKIDVVDKHLNRARAEAHKAEVGNSLYVGLASGMEALRVAIDRNDGQAARVGIDVVRTECGYVKRG